MTEGIFILAVLPTQESIISPSAAYLRHCLLEAVGFHNAVHLIAPGEDGRLPILEVAANGRPSCILALGPAAAYALVKEPFLDLCGKLSQVGDVPLVVTYDPQDLLHAASDTSLRQFGEHLLLAANTAQGVTQDKVGISELVQIRSHSDALKLAAHCRTAGRAVFDIETKPKPAHRGYEKAALVHWMSDITCMALSFQPGSAYGLPMNHAQSWLSPEETAACLKVLSDDVFSNAEIDKYGWNIKFDARSLMMLKVVFGGRLRDVMVMRHLLDENRTYLPRKVRFRLKESAAELWDTAGYEQAVGKNNWDTVALDPLMTYCGMDADLTGRLATHYLNLLSREPELYQYFRSLSTPATTNLLQAEWRGMEVCPDTLRVNTDRLALKIEQEHQQLHTEPKLVRYVARRDQKLQQDAVTTLREELAELANDESRSSKVKIKNRQVKLEKLLTGQQTASKPFNFASNPQMLDFLYGPDGLRLKLPTEKGPGGKQVQVSSTAQEHIAPHAHTQPFIKHLLELRSYEKLMGTYLKGMGVLVDEQHRIHPNFKQQGTVTGRLSCTTPNLQNLPRANGESELVKQLFTAPPGYVLVQIDYSQMELRIAAFLSQDPAMLDAYARGLDLHTLTAKTIMGVTDAEWDLLSPSLKKDYRTKAKSANFGLLYGMGAESYMDYARNTYGVVLTLAEATEQRTRFFRKYAALPRWHERCKAQCRKDGYMRTLMGRKRRLPDIYSNENGLRSEAERQSINAPVQGSGGEMTILAISVIAHRFGPPDVLFVNTVHDSLLFYMRDDAAFLAATLPKIRELCSLPLAKEYFGVDTSPVRLEVDVEMGRSWTSLKEYAFC